MTLLRSIAATLAVALATCSSGPGVSGPVTVEPNPNPAVPLAAVVKFVTKSPVKTTISVTDGANEWTLDYDFSQDPREGLAVVGMRPDRRHEIHVTVRAGNGAEERFGPFEFVTPALPEAGVEFPPINVTVSSPEKMEPGVTLFNPRRRRVGRSQEVNRFNADFGMLMALDSAGEVVWYYRVDSRISDFEKIRNGNIIFCTADYRLIEIDWLGNTINQWYAKGRPEGPAEGIAVDTLTFHHEIDELPDSNILVLSSEWKEIDNYYTSELDPNAPRKRQRVMGDVIVEFDRKTGEIVWKWHAFEHMDPFRIGYETFSPYWIRRGFPDMVDWSHANNLLYDETDDSVIVNFRYQAAAVKIDRATQQIKWIFGEPSGWGELSNKVLKAEGEIEWPYHQHSPSPTPNGTLLLFDNGNYQARPFRERAKVEDTYSRAVEFKIDEQSMTVSQVWKSEEPTDDRVIAVAMGDADWLPESENVLVAYGALLDPASIGKVTWEPASRLTFKQWTRLREYVRSDPPEVVYEVVLQADEPDMGWTLFGAERIGSVGR